MTRLPTEPTTSSERRDDAPFDAARDPELFSGITLRRIAAYLVDALIIGLITLLALGALSVLGVMTLGLLSPLVALLPLIPLTYHTLLIGGPDSATLGMRLFDVEVRTLDGGYPGYLLAALQTMVFYLSVGLTSWLILLVALFNARGRTLHDYLCGTLAVRTARRLEAPL